MLMSACHSCMWMIVTNTSIVCASPHVCENMEIKNYPIKNRETVGHTYPNSVSYRGWCALAGISHQ